MKGAMGILGAVAAMAAAQYDPGKPLDADVIRLARIKVVASENLLRLPNYTCLQTIERSRRRGPKHRFQLQDTVRVEVALVGGKELFSWPGAGKFEERRIGDMVGGGTIGNGNFALHARSVFLSSAARFEYMGEIEEQGRRVIRYRYRVPRLLSGYQVRMGEVEETVGYSGSFDVDATTMDLLRLEVVAEEIPPRLQLQEARDEMRYARQAIGGSDFLLPVSSELTMVDVHGNQSRNRVQFHSCRQYTGESVLSFEEAPVVEAAPPPPEPVKLVALDEGLDLDLRIESAVRFGAASIGDEVKATVAVNVKRKGHLIVPKGAVARGRIVWIEKRALRRGEGLAVAFQFEELEFPGHRAQFDAALYDIGPIVLPGVQAGFHREASARGPESRENMVYVNRLELPRGFRMIWRTKPLTPKAITP
jgi:hypothetical protein